MNKSLIYLLFLPLLALSACSDEGSFDTEQQQSSSRQALTLSVFANDFATYSNGALNTRATNSGATTSFPDGDRVGVIILDGDNNLLANNIPYTYNDTAGWAFDAANGEGKTICYYDNKATTYIVYYPYSPKGNDTKTIDDLKCKFPPLSNQSTEEAYRASDLLLWKHTGSALKPLSADLTHAYASVSLVPKVEYLLDDGKSTPISVPSSSIFDVSSAIGGEIFVAHKTTDGSYRCIFPAGGSGNVDIRYFYTYIDEVFSGTLTVESAATANTRYTSTLIANRIYTLADARLGDFYCKDASNNVYLIPGGATPTDDQKDACLGIIFWLGDITSANYGLLDGKLTSGTHGLVACKQLLTDPDNEQSQKMTWTYSEDSYVSDWLKTAIWDGEISRPNSFTSIQDQNNMQGYANTVALQEYNTAKGGTSNLRVKPICALANFVEDNPAPINSSGWYWPSFNELKMMCWGQGHTTQGLDGRNMLNRQFEKVNGQLLEEVPSWIYWSSTEISYYSTEALGVRFSDGLKGAGYKNSHEFSVRPVLAF